MSKLRKSAKGQDCTLNIVGVCNYNPETTVLAHLPSEFKGMGNKSPDYCACFACSDCHDAIDGRTKWQSEIDAEHGYNAVKHNLEWYMRRAMVRTWKFWIDEGYIEVK